jgi:hypothetical protein
LTLFNDYLSFLVLYFSSGKFGVAYFALSGDLLNKFVSEFVSFMARVCLNPGVFYVPVLFIQCNGFFFFFSIR